MFGFCPSTSAVHLVHQPWCRQLSLLKLDVFNCSEGTRAGQCSAAAARGHRQRSWYVALHACCLLLVVPQPSCIDILQARFTRDIVESVFAIPDIIQSIYMTAVES